MTRDTARMTPERWQQIREILQKALEMAPEERSDFLDHSCSSDHALRREVETLLYADPSRSFESSAAQVTLTPGTRLGEYEVQRLLATGGMGEVFRARDTRLGRDVAIKVLPSSLWSDADRLRRFEQEARAAAALNHPNILGVFQMGTYRGAPYLVSELLEGETLREQLKRSPVPIRKAIDYGVQIARGLAAAHERGITHRDLKPENLFVTKAGRLKILDFGLVKLMQTPKKAETTAPTVTASDETDPGTVLGTLGYMSPEQVRGQAADHHSDIFAFGAVLYEMLSGKRAFQKGTSADTMSAILNEDPPAISQIVPATPPALQRIVHRCLEKNPAQRFQSAPDLAFALEALSDPSGSSANLVAPARSRLNWTWAAISGVALAISAGLIAWWALPPRVPVVESVAQITHDGESKSVNLETDGTRVYFAEGMIGNERIVQVSANGGPAAPVASGLANPAVDGITGDGSALLVRSVNSVDSGRGSLWLLPLPAGEPRKLGDIEAMSGGLLPDGRVIYSVGSGVYIADKDGSNPRKLAEVGQNLQTLWEPRVSPNGKRIVFYGMAANNHFGPIFEMAADGTGLHQLLQGDKDGLPPELCCPRWTADGKYLLFIGWSYSEPGLSNVWALPEEKQLLHDARPPLRLTNGPIAYTNLATTTRDPRRVFVIGRQWRGQLVRYDPNSREVIPYLGGMSVAAPAFSRDGKWVVYSSYPDFALWRSRTDGSDRLQLTYPPVLAGCPRISPDGTKVTFSTLDNAAYVMSIDGGTREKLTDNVWCPVWSPDGDLIAFSAFVPGKPLDEVRIKDRHSGNIFSVPDSLGKTDPLFLTEDKLVAHSETTSQSLLFDLNTKKWSELAETPNPLIAWDLSPDLKYLYGFTGGSEPKTVRIRLSDHAVETVTSLKNPRIVYDYANGFILRVAPDGSVLYTRDTGTKEIYALTVKRP